MQSQKYKEDIEYFKNYAWSRSEQDHKERILRILEAQERHEKTLEDIAKYTLGGVVPQEGPIFDRCEIILKARASLKRTNPV